MSQAPQQQQTYGESLLLNPRIEQLPLKILQEGKKGASHGEPDAASSCDHPDRLCGGVQ